MKNWTYSQQTQQENALREAGYSLFSNLTFYEWHNRNSDAKTVSLRFNSAEQATSYAFRQLERGRL